MEIAVIASRLPYIDRRALSQAWFSALHLTPNAAAGVAAVARRADDATWTNSRNFPRQERTRQTAAAVSPDVRNGTPRAKSFIGDGAAPARAVRCGRPAPQGRLRVRSYPPFRSSLTVGVAKERVQLLLRREGGTLHVIALCRPQIADVVRRALACASMHFGTQGETLRASVQTLPMVRA